MKVGTRVQLLPRDGKYLMRKFVKGTVTYYEKDRKIVHVKIERCPNKMGYWLGDVIRFDSFEVKAISETEFNRLTFVDIGEKVKVIKGSFKGNVGVVSGGHQEVCRSRLDENSEEDLRIGYYHLGKFLKAYVDLKTCDYSFESLDMDFIQLISEEEYHTTLRKREKGQFELF